MAFRWVLRASLVAFLVWRHAAAMQVLDNVMLMGPGTSDKFRRGCVDSNEGATNRMGNNCAVYSHDPEYPYSSICLDPYYDDSDFTSKDMCCVCEAAFCPITEEIPASDSPCEEWIDFGGFVDDKGVLPRHDREHHSNLGGLGPDYHKPKELRYYQIGSTAGGVVFDLVFQNLTRYIPKSTSGNTQVGDQSSVNVLEGSYVILSASFVANRTFCPLEPKRGKLTFCDVDHGTTSTEVIYLDGITAFYTVNGSPDFDFEFYSNGRNWSTKWQKDPPPSYLKEEVIDTKMPGVKAKRFSTTLSGGKFGVSVKATHQGKGKCDNPTSVKDLGIKNCDGTTVDQSKRCFQVEFESESTFHVGLDVETSLGDEEYGVFGRNFLMGGTSPYFTEQSAQQCVPAGDHVTASGDPHLVNMYGQRFDIMQSGRYTLLRIPRTSHQHDVLLQTSADVRRIGQSCDDIYFMAINITGRWSRLHKNNTFIAGAARAHTSTGWMKYRHVSLKVAHGRTASGVAYLNFFARGLRLLGHRVGVGGLLGGDDHTAASSLGVQCQKTMDV